jgi:hypothetical protein
MARTKQTARKSGGFAPPRGDPPPLVVSSGSVFSETLQEITDTKLEELSKRRNAYELQKSNLLSGLQLEDDPIKRLERLASGTITCLGIRVDASGRIMHGWNKNASLEIELTNLSRFVDQARYDPSLSTDIIFTWEKSLLLQLDMQSLKYAYASLYGQLVMEWLSSDKAGEAAVAGKDGGGDDVDMTGGFENVDNARKLESRANWERMVFEPAEVDVSKLEKYLESVFDVEGWKRNSGAVKALEELRQSVARHATGMSNITAFTPSSLRTTIQGLLVSDLLSDERRGVLRDFMSNNVILSEIADVLNMRMAALDSWSWGSGVSVEQKRQINGTYDVHMHEDLLQAIFLQHIGVQWSVFFKSSLRVFRKYDGGCWESNALNLPLEEQRRISYYLGPMTRKKSLQAHRSLQYRLNYFLTQLMGSQDDHLVVEDGQVEADYGSVRHSTGGKAPRKQLASKACRKSAPTNTPIQMKRRRDPDLEDEDEEIDTDDENDGERQTREPVELKQRLLHILSTEAIINKKTHGEFTAFHSVFDEWNQNLAHQTIYAVMSFLGVPPRWIAFFKKFLEAPVRFPDDDPSSQSRTRVRGVLNYHVLSDVFSEVVLFCLDLAVNRATSGQFLWRVHDDLWFWSPDYKKCTKAWKAVTDFAALTGSLINAGKSGSVRIFMERKTVSSIDAILPAGDIRWGFLYLSSETGRFQIDQDMVDAHIEELRKQLRDSEGSIFAFIQVWNTYVTKFFTANFGLSANCLGKEHVDDMLRTHERIQRQVFSTFSPDKREGPTSIVAYLRQALSDRFNVEDIPNGYFFFPLELGGLGLRSPFIPLLQIRESVLQSIDKLMQDVHDSDETGYKEDKEIFDNGSIKRARLDLDDPDWEPETKRDREAFMSFEEYIKYTEEFYYENEFELVEVFGSLMSRPREETVRFDSAKLQSALTDLEGQENLNCIRHQWTQMEAYWQWIAMFYGPEIVKRFGGLRIVDAGLLPMGMVTLFRERRVKWQG